MVNFFEMCLTCIADDEGKSTKWSRFSAAYILRKLLEERDLYGMQEVLMKEGALPIMAKGIRDESQMTDEARAERTNLRAECA